MLVLMGIFHGRLLLHVGIDQTGVDGVAADRLRRGLSRDRLGKAEHATFARRVGANALHTNQRRDGRHIDDASGNAGLAHQFDAVLGAQKHAGHIDRHLPLVILKAEVFQGLQNGNARIVNQHVELPAGGFDSAHRVAPRRLRSHILLPGLRLAAGVANFFGGDFRALCIEVGNDHRRALLGVTVGDSVANAGIGRCAGDQANLVVQ